jgi:hypothetical protein
MRLWYRTEHLFEYVQNLVPLCTFRFALLTPVGYNSVVRERRAEMEKCLMCGVQFGQYEGFGQVCQGCYVKAWEEQYQASLEGVK